MNFQAFQSSIIPIFLSPLSCLLSPVLFHHSNIPLSYLLSPILSVLSPFLRFSVSPILRFLLYPFSLRGVGPFTVSPIRRFHLPILPPGRRPLLPFFLFSSSPPFSLSPFLRNYLPPLSCPIPSFQSSNIPSFQIHCLPFYPFPVFCLLSSCQAYSPLCRAASHEHP